MTFTYENHGSIYLVRPLDKAAAQWLKDTAPSDAQFFGKALVVEPRYLENVLNAIAEAEEGL